MVRRAIPLLLLPLVTVGLALRLMGAPTGLALGAAVLAALSAIAVAYVVARPLLSRVQALTAEAKRVELELLGQAGVNGAAQTLPSSDLAERARELTRKVNTLAAVVDSMAEGLWITDRSGVVTLHNDALKELLFAGGELVGRRPLELIRSQPLAEAVQRACEHGEARTLEVKIAGVRPRIASVRVAPLFVGGSSAVFHDITELRRLENVRQDFVANVSHELRTPITAIRGYAETLKAGALDDRENAARMVDVIHRQSERLSALVEDLLEIARLESEQIQLSRQKVSVAAVASRAAEPIRPRAAQRRIRLELSVPEGVVALADERGIEDVLLNLLDNAVKYTPPGGLVEIRGQNQDGRCIIAVRDTGIGIDGKHLSRIFERFYRVDKGRSREMGGTGLGLSIVKHLVTAMDGEVEVQSTPGEGSVFTVTLPAP